LILLSLLAQSKRLRLVEFYSSQVEDLRCLIKEIDIRGTEQNVLLFVLLGNLLNDHIGLLTKVNPSTNTRNDWLDVLLSEVLHGDGLCCRRYSIAQNKAGSRKNILY